MTNKIYKPQIRLIRKKNTVKITNMDSEREDITTDLTVIKNIRHIMNYFMPII